MRGPLVSLLVLSLLALVSCVGGVAYLFFARARTQTPAAFVGTASLRARLACPSPADAPTDATVLGERLRAMGIEGGASVEGAQLELRVSQVSGPEAMRALVVPQRLALGEVLDGALAVDDAALAPGIARRPVGRSGELGFFATSPEPLASLAPRAPAGSRLVVGCTRASTGETECEGAFVRTPAALDNDDVESASVRIDELTGAPNVSLAFTSSGARDFEALTRTLVGRRLAIVLDDRLVSAPLVQEPISGGVAMITLGSAGTPEDAFASAQALAVALDVGAPLSCAWEILSIEQR